MKKKPVSVLALGLALHANAAGINEIQAAQNTVEDTRETQGFRGTRRGRSNGGTRQIRGRQLRRGSGIVPQ